ncbi:hypothetical protein K490DRAFT_60496 [Saccharata proteae CBS 121410]|uniref:Uncharacterized protein n=1 Tax=Saccharata proteae CBS 121410 TaxID=1314787 RepID=A0A9P4HP73_9PEZI|nr:hypothetical protein K490DRAFT_60496 [Saccharata proteae CBS 121410]
MAAGPGSGSWTHRRDMQYQDSIKNSWLGQNVTDLARAQGPCGPDEGSRPTRARPGAEVPRYPLDKRLVLQQITAYELAVSRIIRHGRDRTQRRRGNKSARFCTRYRHRAARRLALAGLTRSLPANLELSMGRPDRSTVSKQADVARLPFWTVSGVVVKLHSETRAASSLLLLSVSDSQSLDHAARSGLSKTSGRDPGSARHRRSRYRVLCQSSSPLAPISLCARVWSIAWVATPMARWRGQRMIQPAIGGCGDDGDEGDDGDAMGATEWKTRSSVDCLLVGDVVEPHQPSIAAASPSPPLEPLPPQQVLVRTKRRARLGYRHETINAVVVSDGGESTRLR